MLPVIFPWIADDPAVTALIGSDPVRFYRHGKAPQNVQAPYVTWFLVSGLPENQLDGVPPIDRFSVQIDCWSNNTGDGDEEVVELAKAIRDAIEPHAHMTGIPIDSQDPDTQRYRMGMTFTVWQDRDETS